MKPKISIIVPIYNSSKYLSKCLKSIQGQTFTDFEVLLINDGSTDNSLDICNTFSSSDKRFKVFSQKNSGVSSARNKGIEKSLGEYISFVDSDDWIEKSYCETLLDYSVSGNYDLVMCGFYIHFPGKKLVNAPCKTNIEVTRNEIIESIQNFRNKTENIFKNTIWDKLFKKSIITKNRLHFVENLKVGEDLLFLLEYQKHIFLALKITDKLYNYNRIVEGSATTSYVRDYWDNLILVKKKSFEINHNIANYDDKYKYYQYLRVASKAISEEGKLNNGKNFLEKYYSIKNLCNKTEVRFFCNNYNLPNENDKFYQLIRILIKHNKPFIITLLITLSYRLKII